MEDNKGERTDEQKLEEVIQEVDLDAAEDTLHIFNQSLVDEDEYNIDETIRLMKNNISNKLEAYNYPDVDRVMERLDNYIEEARRSIKINSRNIREIESDEKKSVIIDEFNRDFRNICSESTQENFEYFVFTEKNKAMNNLSYISNDSSGKYSAKNEDILNDMCYDIEREIMKIQTDDAYQAIGSIKNYIKTKVVDDLKEKYDLNSQTLDKKLDMLIDNKLDDAQKKFNEKFKLKKDEQEKDMSIEDNSSKSEEVKEDNEQRNYYASLFK